MLRKPGKLRPDGPLGSDADFTTAIQYKDELSGTVYTYQDYFLDMPRRLLCGCTLGSLYFV